MDAGSVQWTFAPASTRLKQDDDPDFTSSGVVVVKNHSGVRRLTSLLAVAACAGPVAAQITVYNNFGPDHDGWDYNWGLGWTVAGPDVPSQYGVEQAMSFTSTADGVVSDIWVAMWYVPLDGQDDQVVLRLARNPNGAPPTPGDVLEEWTISEFESWTNWSPPHHLVGSGQSILEKGQSYWLWATGGATTWCGWCMNLDPRLTCSHTLRREGEGWLPVSNETASAFRVDVLPACIADFNSDGVVNTLDFIAYLNAYNTGDPRADLNGDGVVNTLDFLAFLNAFSAGC